MIVIYGRSANGQIKPWPIHLNSDEELLDILKCESLRSCESFWIVPGTFDFGGENS